MNALITRAVLRKNLEPVLTFPIGIMNDFDKEVVFFAKNIPKMRNMCYNVIVEIIISREEVFFDENAKLQV